MLSLWMAVALAAWPDLARPPEVGGGEADAALIVGVEDYWVAPRVPGARRNARDWAAWLTVGRGVPADRVRVLLDGEATAEEIRSQAERLSRDVGEGGALWIVFIGHGAPDPATGDAAILGVDVQPTAQSLTARGVSRRALLHATAAAPSRVLVLDSCFSGQAPSGESLAPGLQLLVPTWASVERDTVELTAGTSAQVAGSLPRENRPAFSYLLLGALHGWGDADGDGVVTADEALGWTRRALDAVVVGREQTPQRFGDDRPLTRAGRAKPPDLRAIADARSSEARRPLPVPERPGMPTAPTGRLGVDVEAEELYQAAVQATASRTTSPARTADAWCALHAHGAAAYDEVARQGCERWTAFHEAQTELWTTFYEDWTETDRLLRVATAPLDGKLGALDALHSRYDGASPWATRRIARARARVAAGRGAALPAFFHPPAWALKEDPARGLFWGWDPRVASNPWIGWSVGGGAYLGDAPRPEATIGGELGYGPAIVGLQYGIGAGARTTIGAYAAFLPFTHRPSDRLSAERRWSFLNPSIGAGVRYGQHQGLSATALEGHVANHVWFTHAIGLRVDARLPLYGGAEAAPWIGAALVIDTGRQLSR